jgi:hypothetical protein
VAKGLLAASFAVLIFFTCSGFLAGLPFWPMNRQQRGYGRALVSLINVVPETDLLAKSVFPDPDRVKEAANALNRIGYLWPPLFRSNLIRSQTKFGNESLGNVANGTNGETAFGAFQFNEEASGSIEADGWAFLPDERRPADAVLITIDNAAARGKPEICAIDIESGRIIAHTKSRGGMLAILWNVPSHDPAVQAADLHRSWRRGHHRAL